MNKDSINNSIKDLVENYNWEIADGYLVKEFVCKDFTSAISLIVRIAFESEKLDHHPNINLHSWNKVKVTIYTHSSNSITELDIKLAHQIEAIK